MHMKYICIKRDKQTEFLSHVRHYHDKTISDGGGENAHKTNKNHGNHKRCEIQSKMKNENNIQLNPNSKEMKWNEEKSTNELNEKQNRKKKKKKTFVSVMKLKKNGFEVNARLRKCYMS